MHEARLRFEASPVESPDVVRPSLPTVHVGCSGWFYWHWKGGFYPADISTADWFAYYARRFDTVELNAPFYSWPTGANVQTWIKQAGRRKFIYTVKVSELITHVKRFTGTKTMVRDFGLIADLLGPRMGCFLFQLPPSFNYSPSRLKRILEHMEPGRRNVIEFRHRSWWNCRVFEALQAHGVIFCSCSAPKLPNDLIATDGEVYLRFHGLKRWYRHDYSAEELKQWTERLRAVGAQKIWAYFNNDRDCNAIKNARVFRRILAEAGLKTASGS